MDGSERLWDFVQQILPNSSLTATKLTSELGNYQDKLLNLFQHKGPDASKRQQIRSGRVQTLNMELNLDYDAKTRLVPELSDLLQLDEFTCAELLNNVLDKFGQYLPEAACGLYLSERVLGARALCRLLLLQLFNQLDIKISEEAAGADPMAGPVPFTTIRECLEGDPLLAVVVRNNEYLLGVEEGGRNKLVSRIVAVIKDTHINTRGHAEVWTSPSERTTRDALLMEERAELCRSLLYAVVLSPSQLKASSVVDILSLLEQLVGKVKAAGPSAPHLLVQQATSVLLAAVAALSLSNVAGGRDVSPAAMADLLRSPELKDQLDKLAKPDNGFSAVLCLTWALTKDAIAGSGASSAGGSAAGRAFDGTTPGPTATALLEVAGKAHALGTLSAVLSSVAFQVEIEEEHKHLCARIVYGLLTDALKFDGSNHRELTQRLLEVSSQHNKREVSSSRGGTWFPTGSDSDLAAFVFPTAPPPAAAAGTAGALTVASAGVSNAFFAGQQQPQHPGLAQHDDLSSLLEALAAVYRVRPGLWHDKEAPAAFPYVTTFMSHVVVHPAVTQLPDVMVSILGVMTALAAGPKGSRFILLQFRQNVSQEKLQSFTWNRLFASIVAYCQRYDHLERQAAAQGQMAGHNPGLLAAQAQALMAAGDAMLLIAYLDLLTAVIASGEPDEVRSSLQGLERDLGTATGGGPISEPLFQLMCHGVPTRVKAAVDRCLTAMARFKEVAPHLLQRLVSAAVVNAGPAPMEYAGYNPFDLLLQVSEVEARQEDYSETLAFLDLVNALLTTLGPHGLPEAAVGIAHYTQFVLQHVVGQLWSRGYKDMCQKWQLAAAAFKHCQLVLEALVSWPAHLGMQHMLARGPPGLLVLMSLMGGRQLAHAALEKVLGKGHLELETSMDSGTEGPHRLAAVLAAFKLINTALRFDEDAATALNSLTVRERVAPLHMQLINPQHRLAVLLQYVLYANMDLQHETIKLLGQLSSRLPDIVHLLQPNYDDSAVVIIRQGFAAAFEVALLDPSAGESVSAGLSAARDAELAGGEVGAPPSSDTRAELMLDVMLGTLLAGSEPPTLAHLLLGFDTSSPPLQWHESSYLEPEHELSCMSVLLKALQEPDLHVRKPALFAKCLQLLFCCLEPPLTCELVFSLLQPGNESYGQLLPHLGQLLVESLPGGSAQGQASQDADVHHQVAALRQRASLLQIYSLAMLRFKTPSMLEPMLASLVGASSGAAAVAAGASGFANGAPAALHPYASASGTAALLSLQSMCGVALPQQGIEIPSDLQQLQQDMVVNEISVAALLSQPSVMESVGVVTIDENGQPVFDFPTLNRLLQERFEDYVAKTGGRGSTSEANAREAVSAAYRHAAALNAYAVVAGAQGLAVRSWVQTISVAFTKTYALINRSTAPGCGPELLHSTLLGVLQLVAALSSRGQMGLAAELAGCCRVLMSKLQELAAASLSLGLPGDPLSQVRLPVRCEALLRLLLECVRGASSKYQRGGRDGSSNALRAEMYVCLIQYLHFCRGSKLGDCPPLVLTCLLNGAGPGTSAAQLDALQQQLEEVNGRLLRSCASELVGLMLTDIQQPPHRGGMPQAVALHLLATLLSADKSSTALAEVCHREKVPKALLDSVVTHAEGVVMQHSSKAQGALQVLEGQLFLLLSLTMAGGPMAQKASTKAVADAGVLPALARCKALNYLPEGPSDAMRQNKAGTRRYRLVRLVSPVLRLVLSLLGGAPGSAKMVTEALEFCRGQHKLLGRLLKEAAAPASPSWTPGDEELEQAALAVSLLARLPGALHSHDALLAAGAGSVALAGSLSGLRDDMWQLWQALAGHDKSGAAASGILVMMARTDSAGGTSRMQLERRRSLLLQLRVGLATCLRDLVKPVGPAGSAAAAAAGGSPGSVGPGASELLQLVGPDNHMTMDVLGRPTLLQVHNTAEQAISDTRVLAQDLEGLMDFLSRSEAAITVDDVSAVLSQWGPSLAALSSKPEAPTPAADGANGMSNALVLAGDAQQGRALPAAGAGAFGGLDPAAARRLARQCAAKGASVLLSQLSKQLNLTEQCLVIVLLHLVQCLPRPDTSAVAGADDMQLDADGSMADALLPNPGPEMAAVLGDTNALRFFAARMRNVCSQAAGMGSEVSKVVGVDAAGGTAAVGTRQWLDSLDAIDLLTRRLNAYLADR